MSDNGASVDSAGRLAIVDNTVASVIMKGSIAGKSNYEGLKTRTNGRLMYLREEMETAWDRGAAHIDETRHRLFKLECFVISSETKLEPRNATP